MTKINSEIDEKNLLRTISSLKQNKGLMDSLDEAMKWRQQSFPEKTEIEEMILPDFPNFRKSFISAYNLTSDTEKVELISRYSKNNSENKFIKLAERLQQILHPETTTIFSQEAFQRHLINRLFRIPSLGERIKWKTFYSELAKFKKLKKKYPHKLRKINELRDFYLRESKFLGINLENEYMEKRDYG